MSWYIILFLGLSVVFGVVILLVIYALFAGSENESEKQWDDDSGAS